MSKQWRINAVTESDCATCLNIVVEVLDTETQQITYKRFPMIPAVDKTAEQVLADVAVRLAASENRLDPTAISEGGAWEDWP